MTVVNSYQEQLRQNRLKSGKLDSEILSPAVLAWRIERSKEIYQYDSCYDYLSEIKEYYINEHEQERKVNKCQCTGYELFAETFINRGINCTTNIHKLAHTYWLSMHYNKFLKNYKQPTMMGLKHLWITFNFSDKLLVPEVVLEMERILGLALWRDTTLTYCYEYNTGEDKSHPHVHMLIQLKRTGTIKKTEIIEKVFQKKGLDKKLNLNIKFSWATDFAWKCNTVEYHLAYLNGKKIDDKIENCDVDKLWRQQNNLENVYVLER